MTVHFNSFHFCEKFLYVHERYLKEQLFNVLNLGCQNIVKVLNVDLHEFYLIFPSSINYQLTEVFRYVESAIYMFCLISLFCSLIKAIL